MEPEELLKLLAGSKEVELENVRIEAEELELEAFTAIAQLLRPELGRLKFEPPKESYALRISEVRIGATQSEGGTRSHSVKVGGQNAPALHFFEGDFPNPPAVAHDVFDAPIPLPTHVQEHFEDAINDPVEWARLRVERFGAKLLTYHAVSIDPKGLNAEVRETLRKLEDVLQAVKAPLIVGGCGHPTKDVEFLSKAAELCESERVLLSSIKPEMRWEEVVEAAKRHEQLVLTLIPMNPNELKRFNQLVLDAGIPSERLVMDPFTGGVGYGIEYSISTIERCRLAGLRGTRSLAIPILGAVSNAWVAREAWMENPAWGPKEWRGPLWEAITAMVAILSGADLLMMLHPFAIEVVEEVVASFHQPSAREELEKYGEWVCQG